MSAEMDMEELYLCACHEFYDSHHPECPALRQYRQQAEEIARLKWANRTRHDYDLTCSQCGKAHILDTSLPSEIWSQIAQPEDILCTLCIDERLAAKGLSCFAEFYFVGAALTSKLYSQDLQEANATLTRQLQEVVEERDRYRESLERIRLRAAPGPDDRNFDRCIQDLMWCDDEARRALFTERSTD